jgi:hypothetical protein
MATAAHKRRRQSTNTLLLPIRDQCRSQRPACVLSPESPQYPCTKPKSMRDPVLPAPVILKFIAVTEVERHGVNLAFLFSLVPWELRISRTLPESAEVTA